LTSQPAEETRELGELLGDRLKERRRGLGRKLAEVAAAAEVSTGYLSSIENGSSIPSLPVLARLAHALDLSLTEMLRSSASARLARGHIDETPGREALALESSPMQIVRLGAQTGESGRSPVELVGTDVFIYQYRGRLEVEANGERYELRAGDGLHCELPASVTWHVAGEKPAVSVWVTSAAPRKSIS
jgi:transcriptional regulator with XRE-family HTH domain